MERLLVVVRENAPPAVWSAGVELARNSEIQEVPSTSSDERSFRLVQRPRDPVVTVSLSEEHEVWQSDCTCVDDPCRHVVATVISLRQDRVLRGPVRRAGTPIGRVVHSFSRSQGCLSFSRFLEWGDSRRELTGSLAAALREIRSGDPSVAVSREEEQVDHVLPSRKSGTLDPKTMRALCSVLARLPSVELDGVVKGVSSMPLPCSLEVVDDGDDFRIRIERDPEIQEVFENGLALRGDMLCAVADTLLSADEWRAFSGPGKRFARTEALGLVSEVLPRLEGRIDVAIKTSRLPHGVRALPRIVVETIGDAERGSLTVVPHLVYGDPPIAEVRSGRLEPSSDVLVPIRDPIEEARLARELQARLSLRLDQAKGFTDEAAVHFVRSLEGWQVSGNGAALFTPARRLQPSLDEFEGFPSLSLVSEDGRRARAEDVLKAWRGGAGCVRLEDGLWGELPRAWLDAHREAAERLLLGRGGEAPSVARAYADLDEICTSLNLPYPAYFEALRSGLEGRESIPEISIPSDVTAELRSYQKVGVHWLSFLRDHGLGALLADDMGLGKTLQAICVVKGLTLVVAPTSVLFAWEEQLKRFRPTLKICRYHGPGRRLEPGADLVITTYAILRLDIEELERVQWETILLDESQTIRNPESQVSRAAYRLKGRFKVNLSGTPVENSLEDLWSQFHFLNPGLLGDRREFEQRFATPITGGDTHRAGVLRKRIAPFMLRRLKREVARELPPKTEVVLECELDEGERLVYDAVLAASRAQIVEAFKGEHDPLSVFEVLLRLRQACCHSALIPGQAANSSSKVRLLVDSLERSIAQGHRALVFSQWTSFLDLVEPALKDGGITWSRIDGATRDRQGVVSSFQRDDGPHVLLLSLKAGGVGLNLTAADHVYILDPWWNPAVEDQAADRAYRIGQENPVLVHRLVARDTVEERVLLLQERKRGLLASAVGEGQEAGLTREDILELLDS